MTATPPPVIHLPAEQGWCAPVRPLVITSRFGPRPAPYGPLHPGVDLHAPLGTECHAVDDGVIARSYCSWSDPPDAKPGMHAPPGWKGAWPRQMGFGETVWLLLDDGRTVVYAHLSRRLVEAGEHVRRGQVLGLAGSTGWSSGPHLHLEVRLARGYLDPAPFLESLINPLRP
jgi:murein DD-endopeptidase MepM/ murein hydrolase activator NlpD